MPIYSSAKLFTTTEKNMWTEQSIQFTSKKEGGLSLTGTHGQVVDGFGGCFNELGYRAAQRLGEADREEFFDRLFMPDGDLRFGICRLPIGANDFSEIWYSYDEVDGDFELDYFNIERDKNILIPYIRQAQKRNPNLKLFASPWSPPTWMKTQKVYNFGRIRMEPKVLEAYALYFLKFVEAYKAEGITINQIHVQNEPLADQKFPSCVWSAEDLKIFIRDYLGPLFEEKSPETEIWLGTINAPEPHNAMWTGFEDYANNILLDEKAYGYIKGVGYQWAGKNAILQTHMEYPEKKLMQTECECGDGQNSWLYARYISGLFWHYFNCGANAFVYWNMILPEGGMSTWGWPQNSLATVTDKNASIIYNPEYYVMRHYSGFVDVGAHVLKTAGRFSASSTVFQNPDGSIVAVVNNYQQKRVFTLDLGSQAVTAELQPYSINTIVVRE